MRAGFGGGVGWVWCAVWALHGWWSGEGVCCSRIFAGVDRMMMSTIVKCTRNLAAFWMAVAAFWAANVWPMPQV